MSIWGVLPNHSEINVKSTAKSANSLHNYNGPSFSESMMDVARAAKMQIAGENGAASLAFSRNKEEEFDKPFSFLEAEEEILEDSIARIKKLFDQLKK